MSESRSFWHWPGWTQLGYAMKLGMLAALVFVVVYGGADWLARRHSWRVRLHSEADLALPLAPSAATLYLSLNLLLWMAPFVLRSRDELAAFAKAIVAATLIAGVCFVLLPAEVAFRPPRSEELGGWAPLFEVSVAIALKQNFFPSLHVAFTTLSVVAYAPCARPLGKSLLAVWGVGIVVATLLTHQHYLLDVLAGTLLGAFVARTVYFRGLAARRSR